MLEEPRIDLTVRGRRLLLYLIRRLQRLENSDQRGLGNAVDLRSAVMNACEVICGDCNDLATLKQPCLRKLIALCLGHYVKKNA